MADEEIKRTLRQYIAGGAAEGAMAAAQRLSEAIGITLSDVLEAVQKLGPWEPGVSLSGEGSISIGAPAGTIAVRQSQELSPWRTAGLWPTVCL